MTTCRLLAKASSTMRAISSCERRNSYAEWLRSSRPPDAKIVSTVIASSDFAVAAFLGIRLLFSPTARGEHKIAHGGARGRIRSSRFPRAPYCAYLNDLSGYGG